MKRCNQLLMTLACLNIAGCCSVGSGLKGSPSCEKAHRKLKFEQSLDDSVGVSVDVLLEEWGPASAEQELRNGGHVYVWYRDGGTTTRSNSTPTRNILTGEATGGYQTRTTTTDWSCAIRASLDEDGTVTSTRYKGNDCY